MTCKTHGVHDATFRIVDDVSVPQSSQHRTFVPSSSQQARAYLKHPFHRNESRETRRDREPPRIARGAAVSPDEPVLSPECSFYSFFTP